jgi:hypothetical protein
MRPRYLIVITALVLACAACYGQKPDSPVEKWWYTEIPQGYTDQGTSVAPPLVGNPGTPVSGSSTTSNNYINNNNRR